MAVITIDGKEYPVENLSENAKKQVANINVTDQEIAKLNAQLAIFKTARIAYANALKNELDANPEKSIQ